MSPRSSAVAAPIGALVLVATIVGLAPTAQGAMHLAEAALTAMRARHAGVLVTEKAGALCGGLTTAEATSDDVSGTPRGVVPPLLSPDVRSRLLCSASSPGH